MELLRKNLTLYKEDLEKLKAVRKAKRSPSDSHTIRELIHEAAEKLRKKGVA